MSHEYVVAQHQADAVLAWHLHADPQYGNAVSGVGIAVMVVEQFPVQRYLKRAPTRGYERNTHIALAKIPLRAVQIEPQLALGWLEAR